MPLPVLDFSSPELEPSHSPARVQTVIQNVCEEFIPATGLAGLRSEDCDAMLGAFDFFEKQKNR